MKIPYKKIATLLFLNALCWHGLNCTLATEKQEEVKTGSKRKREQAERPVMSFDVFPSEVTKYTLAFLNIKADQRALLNSSASCKRINTAVMDIYDHFNKEKKHDKWQDNLSLNPLVLYTINSRILLIQGVYNNIIYAKGNMYSPYGDPATTLLSTLQRNRTVDSIRFERLCAQFLEAPYFHENALPKMHVKTLQYHLGIGRFLMNPAIWAFIEDGAKSYNQYLEDMTEEQRVACKNELTLCFYGLQFVYRIEPPKLAELKKKYRLNELDNSFMVLFKLESIKETLNEIRGHDDDNLGQIFDLEPSPTIWQFEDAARRCELFASRETNSEVALKYYTKAAQCYEQIIKALEKAAQNPTVRDYNLIANACSNVVSHTQDVTDKAKYSAKIAYYQEQRLKAFGNNEQHRLNASEYCKVAYHYYKAGCYAQKTTDKMRCFAKAAEYYEKYYERYKETAWKSLEFSSLSFSIDQEVAIMRGKISEIYAYLRKNEKANFYYL